MAINVNLSDANSDGTGVDFNAYLANFDSTFSLGSWGHFSNVPTDFSGDEFAISESSSGTLPVTDPDAQVVVFESGSAGNLEYNFGSHTLAGALDAIEFGQYLAYNSTTDNFSTLADVRISNLGLTGTGAGNDVHDQVYDIMQGNTGVLTGHLNANSINFLGSSGDDSFTGFAQDDIINGGGGDDTLAGGGGDDTFVFQDNWGVDTISGFVSGDDVIQFDGLWADWTDFSTDTDVSVVGNVVEWTDGADTWSVTVGGVSSLGSADFEFV